MNCALSLPLSLPLSRRISGRRSRGREGGGGGGRGENLLTVRYGASRMRNREREREEESIRQTDADGQTDPQSQVGITWPPVLPPSVGRAYINNCNWPSPADFARKLAHARTYVLGTMKRQRRRRSGEGMRCPAPSLAGSLARFVARSLAPSDRLSLRCRLLSPKRE